MLSKGVLTKGALSLGLCGTLLAAPVTSFAAENNVFSGPEMIYTEFGYTNVESGPQRVIEGKAAPRIGAGQCFDNIEGGKWCKGQTMGWMGDWAQFSQYDHGSRVHKASAMANNKTTYGKWKDPGVQAYTTSPYFDSLSSYKSYYDVQ